MWFGMPKDDLFDNPSAMLRWLGMPEGVLFLTYIGKILDFSRLRLEKESEIIEIYRRQGRIDILKDIANLPEELRQQMTRKVA